MRWELRRWAFVTFKRNKGHGPSTPAGKSSRTAIRRGLQAGILHGGELGATGRRQPQLICAIWAKLIGFDDVTFAVGAGGVEVAFAVGAEVEARADGFRALRTWIWQRLAHQEIDDKAYEAPCR